LVGGCSGCAGRAGKSTIGRSVLVGGVCGGIGTLPLPFSFFASGVQQAEQISYSLLSITFRRHLTVCPHRAQIAIVTTLTLASAKQRRKIQIDTGSEVGRGVRRLGLRRRAMSLLSRLFVAYGNSAFSS
jgi:hypothetical protein